MKRITVWICAFALLLCACETKVPVQTTDIAPEITAELTTKTPETTAVTTTKASEITEATTSKVPEMNSEENIAEFVFDACAVPVEKYENKTYVVTEYRNRDDSEIYWTVVTINTAYPQEFRYDLDEAAGPIPSVTTLAVEADINFDGRMDLCIFMGYFGVQGVRRYMGYLQNEDRTYTLCKGFEEILNPVLDTENKVILASARENAAQHWYGKYAFDGETVACIDELVYTAGDGTVEWEGSTYSVAPGTPEYERFIGADGEWNLLSEKWADILAEETENPLEKVAVSAYETYAHENYAVAEYRSEDGKQVYWMVVTKEKQPNVFRYYRPMHAGIPTVKNLVLLEDINFDGRTDLCIFTGFTNSMELNYIGYLANDDGTYTLCNGFYYVSDPVLDAEKEQVLGSYRDGASCRRYFKYIYEEGSIKQIDHLAYFDDETVEWEGTIYSVAPGTPEYERFIGADGEWDLLGEKWTENVIGMSGRK